MVNLVLTTSSSADESSSSCESLLEAGGVGVRARMFPLSGAMLVLYSCEVSQCGHEGLFVDKRCKKVEMCISVSNVRLWIWGIHLRTALNTMITLLSAL